VVTTGRQAWSSTPAPVYAVLEGMALGSLAALLEVM
jgi:uncharacterized YccA/Bax inhibitor family protein